jgi:hypothetical protein
MSVTRKAATQRSGASLPYSVAFDEIEKRITTCSMCCCKCSMMGGLPTPGPHGGFLANTIIIMTSNLGSPIIQEYF